MIAHPLTILTQSTVETSAFEHFAVMDSIHKGFKQVSVAYNYNPKNPHEIRENVWVVCGSTLTLTEVIELKKAKKVNCIIAGPCISLNEIIDHLEWIDAYIVGSDWTKQFIITIEPRLEKKIQQLSFGVDPDFWQPLGMGNNLPSNYVLVYDKLSSNHLVEEVVQMLIRMRFIPIVLKYGKYNLAQYKEILQKVTYAVFLSLSESQGLALLEAWMMNIPTFVWKTQNMVELYVNSNGISYKYGKTSPAPYLTDKTGAFWSTLKELERLLYYAHKDNQRFAPRQWALQHSTNEIVAKTFLTILDKLVHSKDERNINLGIVKK